MIENQKYRISDLKPLKNHIYLVKIDDKEYKLHEETILKYRLLKDHEFSNLAEIIVDNETNILYSKIRAYAIRYPKSSYELRLQLKNKYALDDITTDNFIERLKYEKILNDNLYCESLISSLKRKGYGENYIYNTLRQKGLDTNILIENDSSVLEHMIAKQLKNYKGLPLAKQKEKLTSYLLRKGYNYSLIKEKLAEIFS